MTEGNPQTPPGQAAPAAQGEDSTYILTTIIDAIPYQIFYRDPQGRLLGWNRAFEQAQPNAGELLGRTLFDLLPEAEAARLHRKDQALLATGGSSSDAETLELPQGIRQMLIHKAVFPRADGGVGGIVIVAEDITERKELEAALRQSQELLATINGNVTDLIAIIDPQGWRIYSSPSYFSSLGYTQDEMAAMPPLALVHPDDRNMLRLALANVFENGLQDSAEYRLRHKDGRYLCFESKANPIRRATGEPFRALLVARDITERKNAELARRQMEVQLRHAQKLESIGSLAAGIAHEINTPIQYIGDNTAFLGGAVPELLTCLASQRRILLELQARHQLPNEAAGILAQLQGMDLDYLAEEVPKSIRQTLEGVARVAAIVSAMKDFSHPGLEGKALANLNRAIESTLTVSRNEWKYVARLQTDLDPELPPVLCLQGEINQAILNLVINAAHAIEEVLGGRNSGRLGLIRVSTRRHGPEVQISVSDDGSGIPEGIRERIFEPFFTTKPVGRGTGQGLAIVHAVVVEKHGGRVTVESQPGSTTFHLFLPVQGPAEAPGRGG